jgi:hypothetical protein
VVVAGMVVNGLVVDDEAWALGYWEELRRCWRHWSRVVMGEGQADEVEG